MTASSTGGTPAISILPAPLKKSADFMVLIIVIAALLLAWNIRKEVLGATQDVSAAGVKLSIPARSSALSGNDLGAWGTRTGMAIRINITEAPPAGTETFARLKERADRVDAFAPIGTERIKVAGTEGDVIEYAYADTKQKYHSSVLRVIHVYELLVVRGKDMYIISLEGDEEEYQEIKDFWPRLLKTIQLPEAKP